ncbi:MAG: hypothetical protein ACOC38_12640 [Promethearchaeia archaeon]
MSTDMNNEDTALDDRSLLVEMVSAELEIMDRAFQESLESFNQVNDTPNPLRLYKLLLTFLFIEQESFSEYYDEHNLFFLYFWESWDSLRASCVTAFSFGYSAAFSLLRIHLETVIRGAFYDLIRKTEYRESSKAISITPSGLDFSFRDLLEERIQSDSAFSSNLKESSAAMNDFLSTVHMDPDKSRTVPPIYYMAKDLEKWNCFEPFELGAPHQVYGWLSDAVHVAPLYMNLGIQMASDGDLFTGPQYVEKAFEHYLLSLNQVLELVLHLALNLGKLSLEEPELHRALLKLTEEYHKEYAHLQFAETVKELVGEWNDT